MDEFQKHLQYRIIGTSRVIGVETSKDKARHCNLALHKVRSIFAIYNLFSVTYASFSLSITLSNIELFSHHDTFGLGSPTVNSSKVEK